MRAWCTFCIVAIGNVNERTVCSQSFVYIPKEKKEQTSTRAERCEATTYKVRSATTVSTARNRSIAVA